MGKVSGFLHFTKMFPTEQICIDYFEKLRWKDGVVSPFDKTSKVYKCGNGKYRCSKTGKYKLNS